jgi:chromosome segregation ATPase
MKTCKTKHGEIQMLSLGATPYFASYLKQRGSKRKAPADAKPRPQNKTSLGNAEELSPREEQEYDSSSGEEENVAEGVVCGTYQPGANKVVCLMEELARVKAEHDAKVNELINRGAKVSRLENENKELSSKLDAKANKVPALTNALAGCDSAIGRLVEALEQCEVENSKLQNENKALASELGVEATKVSALIISLADHDCQVLELEKKQVEEVSDLKHENKDLKL